MQMPTAAPINTSSSRSKTLKWGVAALLAVMLVGVSAIAYWLPVKRYIVTCTKLQIISCALQRETPSEHRTWQVDLGNNAIATVKIQPARRGSARVFLYLNSNFETFFAAEFEGGAAVAQAQAAAAELNHFFSSALPAPVRIVASPPAYLTWMLWGGIGFLCMLVLVIYREMFNWKHRPSSVVGRH